VDATAAEFDDTGRLTEDFEVSVASNFASTRYSLDGSTSRVAGPLFDTPGYRFFARNLKRHDVVDIDFDLLACGARRQR